MLLTWAVEVLSESRRSSTSETGQCWSSLSSADYGHTDQQTISYT